MYTTYKCTFTTALLLFTPHFIIMPKLFITQNDMYNIEELLLLLLLLLIMYYNKFIFRYINRCHQHYVAVIISFSRVYYNIVNNNKPRI